MNSKLNKEEFIQRLKENLKQGDPMRRGNPMAVLDFNTLFSKKPFLGTIDKTKFQITTGHFFKTTPYIIDGEIKNTKTGLEVLYKIKPIWFGYLFIRIMPVLLVIGLTFLIFVQDNQLQNEEKALFGLIGVFMLTPIFVTIRQKRKLIRNFKTILEIEE